MDLLKPYECCEPRLEYVCGEYFVFCDLCDCCNFDCKPCFSPNKDTTIKEWNKNVSNASK